MSSIAGWLSCGWEGVLVVDESDVAPGSDGSRFVSGRLFCAADHREVVRLEQALEVARSEGWHTNRRGSDSLFRSPRFADVVSALRDLEYSAILDMRVTPSEVEEFREEYRDALETQPGLRPTWRSARDTTVEEIAFFRYLALAKVRAAEYLASNGLRWNRVLAICDRQPGLNPGQERVFLTVPTYAYNDEQIVRYEFEARAILDKTHSDTLHSVRAVGLVDGELWSIRRFLAQLMRDGRRLDEHFKEWAERGDPDDPVLTQELVDRTADGVPNLAEYVQNVFMWMHARGRVLQVTRQIAIPPSERGGHPYR